MTGRRHKAARQSLDPSTTTRLAARLFCRAVLVVAALCTAPADAKATRDFVSIVGPRTVYPLAAEVVDRFGANTPFKYPYIETTETDAGIALFCAGVGAEAPDLALATRDMTDRERGRCTAAGADNLVSSRIGFEAIEFIRAEQSEPLSLTAAQLFQALAAKLPTPEVAGSENAALSTVLIDNPHTQWSDISPDLPDEPIRIFAPSAGSVEYDLLIETAMKKGCAEVESLKSLAELDPATFETTCTTTRADDAWHESNAARAEILAEMDEDPQALAVIRAGLAAPDEAIKTVSINGALPTVEEINNGRYLAARPVYLFVKPVNLPLIPGLREFVAEFIGPRASGADGYLKQQGLIPLAQEARAQVKAIVSDIVAAPKQEPDTAQSGQGSPEARLRQAELALWTSVQDSDDPARVQTYLNAFPTGIFAQPAKRRIAMLNNQDTDRDGVADPSDACADTPAGIAVDARGCTLDSDGDEIADTLDKCPETPAGLRVDNDGCPLDGDGDGVTDSKDFCPRTPPGAEVDAAGCIRDSDGDGLADNVDACPATPKGARPDERGCWELPSLVFLTGQKAVDPAHEYILREVVRVLSVNPELGARITGYSDDVGDPTSNVDVSRERAAAIASALQGLGISSDRLLVAGLGEANPAADNATEEGRRLNRRVEIVLAPLPLEPGAAPETTQASETGSAPHSLETPLTEDADDEEAAEARAPAPAPTETEDVDALSPAASTETVPEETDAQ